MHYHIVTICALAVFSALGQECKNEQGEPVDWFFVYKLPKIQKAENAAVRQGLGYVYLTSKHADMDWREGQRPINHTKSIIGATLGPIYIQSQYKKLFYALYNDDPPNTEMKLRYGHTKGVVVSNETSGFWLVHSVPRFPPEPMTKPNGTQTPLRQKYSYPSTATKFGQSFLCISLNTSSLNEVGTALKYNRPRVYSFYVPKKLAPLFPDLTAAVHGSYIKNGSQYYRNKLVTPKHMAFEVFAKTRDFKKDLYADLIAPSLSSSLEVESWQNGPGELDPDCRRNFTVVNIEGIGIQMTQTLTYEFKSTKDHSKWAITDQARSYVCIGDINRMESQMKRGGGSVCLRHPKIWSRYKKAAAEIEPCPRKPSLF